jgi:hypothetical protein
LIKVHTFSEGHKILRNLNPRFDRYYIVQIYGGGFAKFCGLLRIYEIYNQFCIVFSTLGSTSEIVSPYCFNRTKNYFFHALIQPPFQQVRLADFEFSDFLTWKRKWISFLVKYIWEYLQFRYSEKATKIWPFYHFFLTLLI